MKLRKILAAVVAGTLAAGAMMTLASAAEQTISVKSFSDSSYVFTTSISGISIEANASATVAEQTADANIAGTVNVTAASGTTLNPVTSHSIEVPKADVTVASGKSITAFRFVVDGRAYSYDYTKTDSAAADNVNLDDFISKSRPSVKNAIEAAGTAKLVISFNKGFTGSEITFKVDGTDKKVAVSGGKAEIALTFDKVDKIFDIGKVEWSGLGEGVVTGAVLAYSDGGTTTSGSGEDITVSGDNSGTNNNNNNNSGNAGANTGTENPKAGVMFAIIPAIVSGAAAIVSKKR